MFESRCESGRAPPRRGQADLRRIRPLKLFQSGLTGALSSTSGFNAAAPLRNLNTVHLIPDVDAIGNRALVAILRDQILIEESERLL